MIRFSADPLDSGLCPCCRKPATRMYNLLTADGGSSLVCLRCLDAANPLVTRGHLAVAQVDREAEAAVRELIGGYND